MVIIFEFLNLFNLTFLVISKTFYPWLEFVYVSFEYFCGTLSVFDIKMCSCVQCSIDLFMQPITSECSECGAVKKKNLWFQNIIAICRAFGISDFLVSLFRCFFLLSFSFHFANALNALISIWPQCHDIWSISVFRLLLLYLSPVSSLCRFELVLRFFIYFKIKSIYIFFCHGFGIYFIDIYDIQLSSKCHS